MNPFKAIVIRLRDQGLAGLLPTKNSTSLRDNIESRRRWSVGAQPQQTSIQPSVPPGYEDPSLSRTATITPGIYYPGSPEHQRQRETHVQLASLIANERAGIHSRGSNLSSVTTNNSVTREYPPLYDNPLATRAPGESMMPAYPSAIQALTPQCNGCKHSTIEEIPTAEIGCRTCARSDFPVAVEDPPIIDRYISFENHEQLYNEWKEKATKRIEKKIRQEILDAMKNEKRIIKKHVLKRVV